MACEPAWRRCRVCLWRIWLSDLVAVVPVPGIASLGWPHATPTRMARAPVGTHALDPCPQRAYAGPPPKCDVAAAMPTSSTPREMQWRGRLGCECTSGCEACMLAPEETSATSSGPPGPRTWTLTKPRSQKHGKSFGRRSPSRARRRDDSFVRRDGGQNLHVSLPHGAPPHFSNRDRCV